MSIAKALEELESSPGFLGHIAHLQRVAQDEQHRREQFYNDLDEDTKAEFINGRVIVHSPVRRAHLDAGFFLVNLLGNYVMQRSLGLVYSEKCLIRCQRNDYEPDICFFSQVKCAGWDANKMIFPPPDLIVEILSPSTASNDRTLKRHDYARHEIGEYWIVDVDTWEVEQYTLPQGADEYALEARLSGSGQLASVVLAGFAVPVAAFFDAQANQQALRALSA